MVMNVICCLTCLPILLCTGRQSLQIHQLIFLNFSLAILKAVFFLPSSRKEPDRLRFQPNNLFTLSEKKTDGVAIGLPGGGFAAGVF
jgi:hypothetical protein